MSRIDIQSLPQIDFAHVFSMNNQNNVMPVKDNMMEITYIAEGSLSCTCNDKTVLLTKGDVVINLYRSVISFKSDGYHCHHTVGFRVEFKLTDSQDIALPELPLYIKASEGTEKILTSIDQIIMNFRMYPENSLKTKGLVLELINLVSNEHKRFQENINSGEYKYVKKAKKYIFEHINEPIMQKEIAAHLGITPEYLCSIFKKSQGVSVINFINKIKLENIKDLMEKEGITLQKASRIYGYSDSSYVSRLYKKYYKTNLTQTLFKNDSGELIWISET